MIVIVFKYLFPLLLVLLSLIVSIKVFKITKEENNEKIQR